MYYGEKVIGHLGLVCPVHIVAYSVLKVFIFGSESLYLISCHLLGVMFNYALFSVMVLLPLICMRFLAFFYIQGVPGGMCQTSGGRSLC